MLEPADELSGLILGFTGKEEGLGCLGLKPGCKSEARPA